MKLFPAELRGMPHKHVGKIPRRLKYLQKAFFINISKSNFFYSAKLINIKTGIISPEYSIRNTSGFNTVPDFDNFRCGIT